MIIEWKMSIGYPTAVRNGEIEVDESALDDMTESSQKEYISDLVWEAAIHYVDTSWNIIKGEQGK